MNKKFGNKTFFQLVKLCQLILYTDYFSLESGYGMDTNNYGVTCMLKNGERFPWNGDKEHNFVIPDQ